MSRARSRGARGEASAESLAAREANRLARKSVDEVAAGEGEYVWAFFCECGDPDCLALVELTVAEFDELVERRDARVLAEGHEAADAEDVLALAPGRGLT